MKKKLGIISLLFLVLFFPGCGKKALEEKKIVIADVGTSKLYFEDFIAGYEVTKIGYPHNELINDAKELKEDVLTQLIEEELILNEALQRGIKYSDEEFKRDLSAVKAEYPDNVFEELLAKNAIEKGLWEKRFRREMAIKKALNQMVYSNIDVSAEALKKGFLEYCKENSLDPESEKTNPDVGKMILEKVKRQKSEANYDTLLENLKKNIKIEVNKTNWESILKSDKY